MYSITYGEVQFEEMYSLIKAYLSHDKNCEYEVSIGTDSQNYSMVKVSIAVGIHKIVNNVGRGGIFFSEIKRFSKITNIRQKLFLETSLSLELAIKLRDRFQKDHTGHEILIHVDAGLNGPSSMWVDDISGWVRACGFTAVIKPDSYMASSIANRLTK
jgi:hypothetical protein